MQGGATSQISSNSVGASAPKATRPKSVCQWSVVDVQKWLRRQCGDYYHLYSESFLEQDITGNINKQYQSDFGFQYKQFANKICLI